MMETERTSGNGKTPEYSALFFFRDRGQFLAGLRMRGWRQEFRVGFQEGFVALVILCFALRVIDFRVVFSRWVLLPAGIMMVPFLIPLYAGRCARTVGAGGRCSHPLILVAGLLVPEVVLVVLSYRSNLSMLVLRALCLALTYALVTACTITLGALEAKTRGRVPGVWLGRLVVTLFGCGLLLETTSSWWHHPFLPWAHVSGFYMIAHDVPRGLRHAYYGGGFPWGRLLFLQLTAQLPLLLLVLDALRGILGGRSLVGGAKPRVLFMAVHSNAWLLLYHATASPYPPWSVTMYFAWTALVLAAATLLFCCPSRDRLERGICGTSGRPGWLDNDAPVGWLTAAVVLLCLAAHTTALAGFGFLWRMDGTQTGVFLLLCVNLVAAAMAWQCGRAARGKLLGFALTGAVALCWGWTLYLEWPPVWTTLISPFGSLGVVKRYILAWYGSGFKPPIPPGLLTAAILFNMVLVGLFSILLAEQCRRMRKEAPGG